MSLAERRAWALKRGNPLWLWPEISSREWQVAMARLEGACAAALGGEGLPVLEGDPAAIGLAAYTSGMGPMLGWWLDRGLIAASSDDVAGLCRRQLSANRTRMERLFARVQQAIEGLVVQGIDVTMLKGIHTASVYFPDMACRPMADTDLLISHRQAHAAERVLQAIGYRQTARTALESAWVCGDASDEPRTMVSLEADDPWALDLHVSLDVPGPPGAARARLSLADGRTAPSRRFPGARQLAQPLLLLHLAAHAGSGFHSLTLLRLVEIIMVVREDRAAGSLSWDEFRQVGAATDSLAFAYPALAMARQLSPTDIPEPIVERCASAAPERIRRVVDGLRPATAHRIDRPTLREHFAWTSGPGGWLRRLAADLLPQPRSLRASAAIHVARARGLLSKDPIRPRP